jgi:hypothetical protein
MKRGPFTKRDIDGLLRELDAELAVDEIRGELYLVGGAVMCLVHEARAATRDVDGFFRPSKQLRAAAARVAERHGMPDAWLNDAVKGFFSERGRFNVYLELEHLTVYAADAEYLLAMKCLAARIGEEFHDLDDIRYLLRYLNVTNPASAKTLLAQYYPLERFPQKTLYMLDELLAPP